MVSVLYFSYFLVATFAVVNCRPDAEPEKDPMKEAAMALINDCKVNVKATDNDVKIMMAKKMPETHEGMCLIECLFNKGGIMENGKFNKGGTINVTEPLMKEDEEKIKKLHAMLDECEKEIGDGDADKCKTAMKIAECTMTKGKSFGFKFSESI